MKYYFLLLFVLCTTVNILLGQDSGYSKIKDVYESFEHENVIRLSDELLRTTSLSDSLLVNIFLMRAVSFYALGDENNCKNSFTEILKLKSTYEPDPSAISPKIISIFGAVRAEFLKNNSPSSIPGSTLSNKPTKVFDSGLLSACAVKNIFIPGWGQFQAGNTSKGIILGTLSTANLVSMLYFISDTNKKENDYLNSTDQTLIQKKYDDYNKSYKIRNVLIISYAAVWLFSQLDLFFFSEDSSFLKETISINSNMQNYDSDRISLGFKVPF